MTADTAIVTVDGLVRRFGETTAVDGVSFSVARGEMFGVIGPDGAGKTTTLRVVLGLLRPDVGKVRTCGIDPYRRPRDVARRVGYLSQRFSLYGDLSVDENVEFFASVHGVKAWRKRRDELLEMLRLTPFRDRLADKLSGGMKQKLALACTLVHEPELLVLDEPTTGVDPVSRRDFWTILARLRRGGLTTLLTTPYLDEAERCERVALVDHGKVLALDAPDALRSHHPGAIVEVIARPRDRAKKVLVERDDVGDVQAFGERLHATLPRVAHDDASEAATRLAHALAAAGADVESARAVTPSLEDVFLARLAASASIGEDVP